MTGCCLSGLSGSAPVAVVVPLDLLSEPEEQACRLLLSPQEQARADRFLRPGNRREYTVAHALKRILLALRCRCSPQALLFGVSGEYGKPCLLMPGMVVDFNISHTAGAVGCAVWGRGEPEAGTVAVGFDLESLSRPVPEDLAASFFAAEEAVWIRRQPLPLQAFLQIWTLKEAFVKAAGQGLALGLETFSMQPPTALSGHPAEGRVLRQSGPACLGAAVRVWQWQTAAGPVAAMVTVGDRAPPPVVVEIPVAVLLKTPPCNTRSTLSSPGKSRINL